MTIAAAPAIEVLGFAHGGVTVSDMDASLAFYRDALGLSVTLDAVRDARYTHEALAVDFDDIRIALLAVPGAPGISIELLEYRGGERMPARARPNDPGSGHLCLVVRDLDSALSRLQARGHRSRSRTAVAVDAGPNIGGKLAYVADPDGYWIELIERPAAPSAP